MKVSFSGIYDIRYPYGTKPSDVKRECHELSEYVDKTYNLDGKFKTIDVDYKDSFNTQRSNKKLADSGIRIVTTFDNPYTLADIFNFLDKKRNQNLVQQYIDNSKVEVVLDA